jgi:DNA transposition AAA+ family ATPase
MLNQDAIDSKTKDNMRPISDDELDNLRKIEPQTCNEKPYDLVRYERIKQRVIDEIAIDDNALLKIANITKPKDFRESKYTNNLWCERISEWMRSSENMRQPGRYFNQASLAEMIEDTLEKYFHELDEIRAEKKPSGEFVETSVFLNIAGGFLMAREECRIVEISTMPGSGKTTAAKHFIAQCRKDERFTCPVWMITLTECNITNRIITWEIYKAIAGSDNSINDIGSPERNSEYEMNERIAEWCVNNPNGLLIIDEAQHIGQFHGNVRPNSLNIINALRNYCDRGLFGIALLSNGEVYDRTKKTKNSTQLSSRIWRVKVNKPTESDIDMVMSAWGVSGKLERELSIQLGTGEGCLRTLTDAYRMARYKYPGEEITYGIIKAALRG